MRVINTEMGDLLIRLSKIQVENPRQEKRRDAYLKKVKLLVAKRRKYEKRGGR